MLPVYAVTKNPILCYNLLFPSTFVLSGLGMFLFTRELTGDRDAAIVAGLAYAFAPYRVGSLTHLQVLSSAWMPFALFGFRRYFATGRTRPLAGAAAAWIAQNLSCGYYLVFFSPVVALYVAWEITTRRAWSNGAVLGRVGLACLAVAAVTVPFLVPYLELRRLGFSPRSLRDSMRFSADVYAYFTADPNLRVWGSLMQAWPMAEGSLFPGLTILGLAAAAIGAAWRGARVGREPSDTWAPGAIAVFAAISLAVLIGLLLGYPIRWGIVRVTSLPRTAGVAMGCLATLLVVSADARLTLRRWLESPVGAFTLLTVFAAAMSLGPEIHVKGRVLADTGLYAVFYNVVPGVDGLRVPARFGMIVALTLSVLAAFGVRAAPRGWRRGVSVAAAVLILTEAFAVPIPINQRSAAYQQAGLVPLGASVSVVTDVPEVYPFLASLPAASTIIELPFGEPAFDVRYMFYSTLHWKRLVNGYSGGAPQQYEALTQALADALTSPGRAWQAMADSQATHAVVHERSYAGDAGPRLSAWLRGNGAVDVGAFGGDHVFRLHGPSAGTPGLREEVRH